jgi:hypothetical protein
MAFALKYHIQRQELLATCRKLRLHHVDINTFGFLEGLLLASFKVLLIVAQHIRVRD